MEKAIVSLSGGLDSTTLLAAVVHGRGVGLVEAVGFSYGSKHNKYENTAARSVASHYAVPFHVIDLSAVMEGFSSALMAKSPEPVPEGHYEAESMRATVVPGRNMIFATVLAGYAWGVGAKDLFLGIHAGDHFIYPDCRPDFYDAMRLAVRLGTDSRVDLFAPFLRMTKADIVRVGLGFKVPYELTRTCYKDQATPCGLCGACRERLESFQKNGVTDPVAYEVH